MHGRLQKQVRGFKKRFRGGRGLKKEVPGTAGVKKRGSRDSGGKKKRAWGLKKRTGG